MYNRDKVKIVCLGSRDFTVMEIQSFANVELKKISIVGGKKIDKDQIKRIMDEWINCTFKVLPWQWLDKNISKISPEN